MAEPVRAAWWKQGETVTFKDKVSFLGAQRIAARQMAIKRLQRDAADPDRTLEQDLADGQSMALWTAEQLLETVADWTLVDESGVLLPRTAEALVERPVDDITFLMRRGAEPEPASTTTPEDAQAVAEVRPAEAAFPADPPA